MMTTIHEYSHRCHNLLDKRGIWNERVESANHGNSILAAQFRGRALVYYTTSEVAQKVGVSKKTLYSWLKKGIIEEPDRDYKNYRIWSEEHVQKCLEFKNRRIPGNQVRK